MKKSLEEIICEKLKLNKSEERFLSEYNPLHFYCRLKDMFGDDDIIDYVKRYEILYKQIIDHYKRKRDEKEYTTG